MYTVASTVQDCKGAVWKYVVGSRCTGGMRVWIHFPKCGQNGYSFLKTSWFTAAAAQVLSGGRDWRT